MATSAFEMSGFSLLAVISSPLGTFSVLHRVNTPDTAKVTATERVQTNHDPLKCCLPCMHNQKGALLTWHLSLQQPFLTAQSKCAPRSHNKNLTRSAGKMSLCVMYKDGTSFIVTCYWVCWAKDRWTSVKTKKNKHPSNQMQPHIQSVQRHLKCVCYCKWDWEIIHVCEKLINHQTRSLVEEVCLRFLRVHSLL